MGREIDWRQSEIQNEKHFLEGQWAKFLISYLGDYSRLKSKWDKISNLISHTACICPNPRIVMVQQTLIPAVTAPQIIIAHFFNVFNRRPMICIVLLTFD